MLFATISTVEIDDDPDLQASFAEALALIFQDFQDNWIRIYEELEKLRQRIIDARKEPHLRASPQETDAVFPGASNGRFLVRVSRVRMRFPFLSL